ncbi:MAG TPA: chemotaxis protein CheW [Thermoanaerobaculia bacterium]|nr:chemotaxis protein CheW [Thermoanaerobaculia bacterium]
MSAAQYLTFMVRGEEHAVPILRVKEIIEFETVTRVPGTPSWVRGVINLRGSILPVVDLSSKFGHGESAVTKTTCTVVVETNHRNDTIVLGVMADSVSEVLDFAADQIEPPPSFGTAVRVDYLAGMGKVDRKLVLILDIDRLLSPVELEAAVAAADAPALA